MIAFVPRLIFTFNVIPIKAPVECLFILELKFNLELENFDSKIHKKNKHARIVTF